jgi:hypothetical protein
LFWENGGVRSGSAPKIPPDFLPSKFKTLVKIMNQTQKAIKIWMYNDAPEKYRKLKTSAMNERDMIAFFPKSLGEKPTEHPIITVLSNNCFKRVKMVVGNGYVYFFTNYSDEAKRLGSMSLQ